MKGSALPKARAYGKIDPSITIVNVVLLLIFFFVATGSLLNSPTFLDGTPETTVLPLDILPRPILVLASDGTMELNGTEVAAGNLQAALDQAETRLHILVEGNRPALEVLALIEREEIVWVEVLLVTIKQSPGRAALFAGVSQ